MTYHSDAALQFADWHKAVPDAELQVKEEHPAKLVILESGAMLDGNPVFSIVRTLFYREIRRQNCD